MKKIVGFFVLGIACITLNAQVLPNIQKKTPYAKVRVVLKNEGWQPIAQKQDEFDVMANEHKSSGWIEVKQCAGSGLAPCIFVWKNKQGKQIEVLTVGENPSFNAFR